ncbi:glutathione S-transferase 2-like isoform X2 [Rosa rugosa]|uniref:glutathione S-transferase 2-like isoform X2 n=1 Tax=Rosa rugosa TaxID=74645 RepID=UPI002B40CB1C|nr:glutathione S-transferase 2-like isoform X2 [Rosa rugosa]
MASGSDENGDQQLKLYSYYMSSCAYRVRIALNLKGLKYEYKAVNLLKGEQFSPEFRKLNPICCVPVLVDGDIAVSDSFAILLYLEEKYQQHPLLPKDLQRKAINFQAANIVCSSIQPLLNLAVLNYIEERVSPDAKIEWAKVHIGKGFAALEDLLKNYAGRYAIGDEVSFKQNTAVPVDHLELYLSLTTDVVMRFWITVLELHAALWNGRFVPGAPD